MMVAKVVTTGHFIKADDGEIYRLVGIPLEDEWADCKVDKTVVEKVKQRLGPESVDAGSTVWIGEPEGIFIPPGGEVGSVFDKDKDTP
jgi:hypothetical protein